MLVGHAHPDLSAVMKAARFHGHGGVEVLRLEDVPEPVPGRGQCLVRVGAVALNAFDPMILAGLPKVRTPLPMIPGGDVAGEIERLGPGVVGWHSGQRVLVMPNQAAGMMGESLPGGACERIAVDADYLIAIPEGVETVAAAALPVAYGAARRMAVTRGRIAGGEKVLVLGASGGVGTAVVQLAKAAGAEVTAVTASPWKAARLAALGADHVIVAAGTGFVAEAWRLHGRPRYRGGGGGIDVVVNYSGGPSWAAALKTLKRHGRVLTCGATAGYDPPTDLRYIWSFELTIIGSNGWTRDDLAALLADVAAGRLTPVIHAVRPLGEIAEAMAELIARRVVGKQVLIP